MLSSPLLLSSALLAQQALAAMQPAASWAEEVGSVYGWCGVGVGWGGVV